MFGTVRALLTLLMVLGVFTGLTARVFALDHFHLQEEECVTTTSSCGTCPADHEPTHNHGGDSSDHSGGHDEDCSGVPHHHCVCTHGMPLGDVELTGCRIGLPESLRLGVSRTALLPPDEPVFSLDKPPLI